MFHMKKENFKSNGFFTKVAKHQTNIQAKGFHPYNSTDVKLVSCGMYFLIFLDVFTFLVDPKDPKITQK